MQCASMRSKHGGVRAFFVIAFTASACIGAASPHSSPSGASPRHTGEGSYEGPYYSGPIRDDSSRFVGSGPLRDFSKGLDPHQVDEATRLASGSLDPGTAATEVAEVIASPPDDGCKGTPCTSCPPT